eukprot:6400796-Prymnesium_polylepis.1
MKHRAAQGPGQREAAPQYPSGKSAADTAATTPAGAPAPSVPEARMHARDVAKAGVASRLRHPPLRTRARACCAAG